MLDVAALYVEHRAFVRTYIWNQRQRFWVSMDDVDDVVSDVFERVVRAAGRYQDRGFTIRAWLVRIAHNLLVDRARRSWLVCVGISEQPAMSLEMDQLIDLDAAVWRLTARQRAVIAWRYGRAASWQAVGDETGVGLEAAKSLHKRALGTLRRTLEAG